MLALCRLLISLGSAIVPVAFREDWTREWHAELWHQHERAAAARRPVASLDLLRRSAGALVHALWLRKEEWRPAVILQDARYAIRALRRRPAFALVAILTLALAIGATTTVFSVVYGVLLKPLPYRDVDRLVQIWETNPDRNWTDETVAPANLLDMKARSRSFEAFAFYHGRQGKNPGTTDATLTGNGQPERLVGMTVSANFFSVLGADAAAGRTFLAEEGLPNGVKAVVLSDGFWRRRFGADRSIVGRTIELNGLPHLVAGVMPRAFHVPGARVDFWAPSTIAEAQLRRTRLAHWFRVVARLKPGVTLPQAREELTRIMAQLEQEYPRTNTHMGAGLGPLHEWFVGDVRGALLGIFGAVALVLLVACTNVASLLISRAAARRREIAIRVAVGAGRVRLIRQLLTESLVLASCGGVAGAALAHQSLRLLRRLGPQDVPRLDQIGIDMGVLAFVAASVCVTALLFGLAPAWQASAARAEEALKDGARGSATGALLRRGLIVAEVTLSVVLLVGAGLFLRSFDRLRGVDPGFDTRDALSFRITLPQQKYADDPNVAGFYSALIERLRSVPGVRAAGAAVRLTLEGRTWTGDLYVESRPDLWGRELRHKAVTPGYLQAAGIRLLSGRDFTEADGPAGPPVVIVNQTTVRQFFGDRDPIGERLAYDRPSANTRWRTIIGVAADERQDGLDSPPQPEVYEPHTQDAANTMSIVVRTANDPMTSLAAVRREVAAIDPAVAIYDVRTLEQVVERSLAEERFTIFALGTFAAVALVLAMVGLYGVIAFSVAQRRQEIGVRIALGAQRGDVLRMVVWDGVRLLLVGLGLGLIGALALGRTLAAFLYQITPRDPLVLVSVVALLGAAGVLASYVPARRAAAVDPARLLTSNT
jgi:putative ABC transport system permease protein